MESFVATGVRFPGGRNVSGGIRCRIVIGTAVGDTRQIIPRRGKSWRTVVVSCAPRQSGGVVGSKSFRGGGRYPYQVRRACDSPRAGSK